MNITCPTCNKCSVRKIQARTLKVDPRGGGVGWHEQLRASFRSTSYSLVHSSRPVSGLDGATPIAMSSWSSDPHRPLPPPRARGTDLYRKSGIWERDGLGRQTLHHFPSIPPPVLNRPQLRRRCILHPASCGRGDGSHHARPSQPQPRCTMHDAARHGTTDLHVPVPEPRVVSVRPPTVVRVASSVLGLEGQGSCARWATPGCQRPPTAHALVRSTITTYEHHAMHPSG